ncbi:MAG TPA: hypothetical protein VFR90_08195 [Methylibium sp.]|uniref:phospholipase D-like domain-containing protein n=1 Tax=Methylibium sp. TaxID=2067992 RepID=UPI002DB9A86F|nr:hypothetical protein [Methylibium sp.]HEU4459085.1 hypothetical protein [Methylibium sp.]
MPSTPPRLPISEPRALARWPGSGTADDGIAPPSPAPAPPVPIERAHAHQLVESLGRPLSAGNRVEPLLGASRLAEALQRAIDGAVNHINLCGDLVPAAAGEQLAERLVGRLRAGVKVNLCCEGHGSLAAGAAALEQLAAAGVSLCGPAPPRGVLHAWVPWWRPTAAKAAPMLIVDGRRAIVGAGADGGGGTAGEANFALAIEGPALQRLQRRFLREWLHRSRQPVQPARYFPPLLVAGTQRLGITDGGDAAPALRALHDALGIACVGVNLVAATPPGRRLRLALASAAEHGVVVNILRSGLADATATASRCWTALEDRGVRVHALREGDDAPPPGLCTIDGVWSGFAASDSAPGLVVLDRPLARRLEQWLRPGQA